MSSCLLSARYTMEADLFEQYTTRDESGQVRRRWRRSTRFPTIDLIARPIMGGGIRVVGSMERWEEEYLPIDWIKFQTNVEMTKRYRVYNIRDKKTGKTLWIMNESGVSDANAPMWFDVVGVNPVIGPFGNLIERDVLAKKVENLETGTIDWA